MDRAGGFFDGKTGAEERRQYLLDLFKRTSEHGSGGTNSKTLSNKDVRHSLLTCCDAEGFGFICSADLQLQTLLPPLPMTLHCLLDMSLKHVMHDHMHAEQHLS